MDGADAPEELVRMVPRSISTLKAAALVPALKVWNHLRSVRPNNAGRRVRRRSCSCHMSSEKRHRSADDGSADQRKTPSTEEGVMSFAAGAASRMRLPYSFFTRSDVMIFM